ncbi:peptidylprolyl isomerase [Algiphilus sp. W345]|uniref:peptidylprolyl isomerase n=1 Tax=Banduia mediterranea TaxID=3075609 RepID=A0ABU2WK58_9GAMM|nr:peptidylprolyl isomerase [Algiphilus sp. W345]MDT0497923.1 peptidylprolyl isomerase [Algiphilus sp. W345]
MSTRARSFRLSLLALATGLAVSGPTFATTSAEILEDSEPSDWRRPADAHLLYMELAAGRVIIELNPTFAPAAVANIKALAAKGYYDGLSIIRVQDNYVTQWGDPKADTGAARQEPLADKPIPAEYAIPWNETLSFTPLPDGDVYAAEVGYIDGFPAARDAQHKAVWLTHCYGMVGVARGTEPDSGSGSQLYVVIGHSPRQLDRNITLAGRVLQGMEYLSALPRGHGTLGFYEGDETMPTIRSVRIAADLPPAARTPLEVLRTDIETFGRYAESRRSRDLGWFVESTDKIEVCNVGVPVRPATPKGAAE